jgi:uncharacterized membrane protein
VNFSPTMTTRQKCLFQLLLLSTALCWLLVIGRLYFNRYILQPLGSTEYVLWTPGYEYLFLIWNLFLAWIPYLAALYIVRSVKKGSAWPMLMPALLVWFFFLPNAPYLITDLKHLHYRPPVPFWYDIVMLFSNAITGLMLGLVAVYEVHESLKHWLSVKKANLAIMGSIALSGFGIWLGRFQRFNSWDVITRPGQLLHETLAALDSRWELFQAFAVSASLAGIFGLAYLFLQVMLMTEGERVRK